LLIDSLKSLIIFFFGLGNESAGQFSVKQLIDIRQSGLNVELLPTEHAISTYNYLCSEVRLVAAALIPPDKVRRLTTDEKVSWHKSNKGGAFFENDTHNYLTGLPIKNKNKED